MQFGFQLPQLMKLDVALTRTEFIIIQTMKLRGDIAGLGVEHQRHISQVMWGMTKQDANSWPDHLLCAWCDWKLSSST